jgi:hypothetical protein
MQSAQIVHMLLERYPSADGWACFAELADATGYQKQRTADFVAISTWPSKGYRAIGFEIKVSRGDFLRELQRPEKRRHLEEVCAECWFVAPAGLLKVEEIPEGWGLLEVLNGAEEEKLRAKLQARHRDPKPWSMPFMAAIVRRCADADPVMPASAWRFAGRDLTLADLRKLLDVLGNRDHQRLREEVAKQADNDRARREHGKELAKLRNAVAEVFGYKATTADGFKAAVAGRSAADPGSKRRLSLLAQELLREVERL